MGFLVVFFWLLMFFCLGLFDDLLIFTVANKSRFFKYQRRKKRKNNKGLTP